jgi:hypothetical protein
MPESSTHRIEGAFPMTRITHGTYANVSDELTLSLKMSENGHIHWSYSQKVLIVKTGFDNVRIVLDNQTGLEAYITSYATTGVSPRRSPIKSDKLSRDRQSIELKIELLPHQLIDFGVFVDFPSIHTTLFCDPQASNDPIKTP